MPSIADDPSSWGKPNESERKVALAPLPVPVQPMGRFFGMDMSTRDAVCVVTTIERPIADGETALVEITGIVQSEAHRVVEIRHLQNDDCSLRYETRWLGQGDDAWQPVEGLTIAVNETLPDALDRHHRQREAAGLIPDVYAKARAAMVPLEETSPWMREMLAVEAERLAQKALRLPPPRVATEAEARQLVLPDDERRRRVEFPLDQGLPVHLSTMAAVRLTQSGQEHYDRLHRIDAGRYPAPVHDLDGRITMPLWRLMHAFERCLFHTREGDEGPFEGGDVFLFV